MPPELRERAIQELSPEEAEAILYDWQGLWARPNQLPPAGDEWRIWLILAGRGFGKSRSAMEVVRHWIQSGQCKRVALVASTAADARDVIVEGESGLLSVCPPSMGATYQPSKRRIIFNNGAICTTYSGDEPGQLRGPQHDGAAVDELAKWRYAEEAFSNLEFGLRLGLNPQMVIATTPTPIPIIRNLMKDPSVVVTRGSTYENAANLAPVFIQRMRAKYEDTRLGRQELHAEVLDDNPNALWSRAMIEAARVREFPDLIRVVTGVDPSGSSSGAECGIVTVGKAYDGAISHYYVLDDSSRQGSPAEWGGQAVASYNKFHCDRVVAETNYGGEMVESTIRNVQGGALVAYKPVHATRGKAVRAEPVAALYEQKRVHHVGMFASLENEMCEWVPGERSPNRMDGLVWAITDLMDEGEFRESEFEL